MEGKGMGRGMLGLEMPPHQHHQMIPFVADHHSSHQQQHHHQARKQQSLYGYERKSKEQGGLSDGEEEGKQVSSCSSPSPWHRMKWTDSMVRLLVMAVYYVGGDDGGEGTSTEKKKGGGNCSLLSSQKKGKWKSVSRAMMEKGFYVSPQQCEDKFNDLNKRYKRVNEILGKGTACRVVENHALLDAMEQIPQKLKEEVRKLLNSKHLFFREMCAYHSSFATTATSARHQSESLPLQQQQQRCFHDEEKRERGGRPATEEYEVDDAGAAGDESEDEDEEEGEEEEEDDDEEEEEEEEEKDDEEIENGHQYHEEEEEEVEEGEEKGRRKRQKVALEILQQLKFEVGKVVEDGSKGLWEQRQWLMKRCEEVEEQRVGYERQALELEKQRFKWLKYSSKKEREMEKMKLENQRRRLENDRMLLLLRNKELELNLLQNHNTNKRPDPSFIPGR